MPSLVGFGSVKLLAFFRNAIFAISRGVVLKIGLFRRTIKITPMDSYRWEFQTRFLIVKNVRGSKNRQASNWYPPKGRQLNPTVKPSIPNRFWRSDNGFEALDEADRLVGTSLSDKLPRPWNGTLQIHQTLKIPAWFSLRNGTKFRAPTFTNDFTDWCSLCRFSAS